MNTNYDVIVVGGGLSGVASAVAAARNGESVLLLEASGCLGGAISQNLIYPFMRYFTHTIKDGKKEKLLLSAGIFKEICTRLDEKGYINHNGSFSPEYIKVILDDLAIEAGVKILFHATLCEVNTENRCVKNIKAVTKSGMVTFTAKEFVDATGDGDLIALAGCEYTLGREKDGLCQPMTLCFRVTGVDDNLFAKDFPKLTPLYNEFQKAGKIKNIREDILFFRGLGKGVVHFNSTRIVKHNPVDPEDLSKAEITARKQMIELYEFLKENFESFKNSTLAYSSVSIGVRESRKLVGEYVLTVEDLLECKMFDDSIAVADYDIDIHNPEGTGTSHHYFKDGEYYSIPYRSLVAKEYDNLFVAGRCLSATHEAQASVRIMPTCCCLGEAVGYAAHLASKNNCTAKNVDITALHALLDKNGAKYR